MTPLSRGQAAAAARSADYSERQRLQQLTRPQLEELQRQRLNQLLAEILPHNAFYAARLGPVRPLSDLRELAELPFTTKEDLGGSPAPGGWPRYLTYPLAQYVRYHQTSGTQGHPLRVLDTVDDWSWWLRTWQFVFDSAELACADRCFLAFSFGPFVGFWSAFDALIARGVMAIPSGGMSSVARIELMAATRPTVLLCTPSYALHLADVAARQSMDLRTLGVRAIIVAGEPGGSIPGVRARIETAWGADLIDHAGASEVGPWGFADVQRVGLHVTESEFIAEFIEIESGHPARDGELAELVLTNLGRRGAPVLRYRTGDMVRPIRQHDRTCRFVLLEGGVLGRRDDMLIIRGVNIFPSSIESILREIPDVAEFRITAFREGAMDQLRVEVEADQSAPERLSDLLSARLGLRIGVQSVSAGSLPRSEFKSRRLVDLRQKSFSGE